MDKLLTCHEKAILIGVLLGSALLSAGLIGFGFGFVLGKLAAL